MTKYEKIREAEKSRFNPVIDCGAYGRRFELDCVKPTSKKTRVSKQGVKDVYIRFNGKNASAECKTNGGRVDDLFDGSNKSKFVIYRLDFVQKHKAGKFTPEWEERRYVSPIIVPTEIFLQCLIECKAVKEMRHGGEVDGLGIQVSSKKLFERLNKWPVKFDPMRNYTTEDFEGLTL